MLWAAIYAVENLQYDHYLSMQCNAGIRSTHQVSLTLCEESSDAASCLCLLCKALISSRSFWVWMTCFSSSSSQSLLRASTSRWSSLLRCCSSFISLLVASDSCMDQHSPMHVQILVHTVLNEPSPLNHCTMYRAAVCTCPTICPKYYVHYYYVWHIVYQHLYVDMHR